jgi:hypothetical protein
MSAQRRALQGRGDEPRLGRARIAEAQNGFRRVKGYLHMRSIVAAPRPAPATVASDKKVA